jgi:hypothetical protein
VTSEPRPLSYTKLFVDFSAGRLRRFLSATNPLLASPYYDEDWDEDEDD